MVVDQAKLDDLASQKAATYKRLELAKAAVEKTEAAQLVKEIQAECTRLYRLIEAMKTLLDDERNSTQDQQSAEIAA